MSRFLELIQNRIVFTDGATGTMLQQAGLKPGENPSMLCFSNPELITDVHAAYYKAGSDIVFTNTFSTNQHKMEGSGKTVEEAVFAAVDCARAAATNPNCLIALDIGPIGELVEPLGTLPFEEAVEIFAQQVEAAVIAGVDLVAIETMMDVYEAKAAVLAVKENSDLPVMVTMTFEQGGRSFTGCDVSSMALTLEACGADVIGLNCSVGPLQLAEIIKDLKTKTRLPIAVKPNAGLPDAGGGYDLTAKEFAEGMKALVEAGAVVIGGCCGTTPEYIKEAYELCKNLPVPALTKNVPCAVCSSTKTVDISTPRIIGERLNPTGKKPLKEALSSGDMNYIMRQALAQQQDGAEILDINVGLPGIDEVEMMAKVVKAVQSVCSLPLQIDSSNPKAIEAGLRVYNGRAIVNSVNGKEECLEELLPIVKKYGAAVIGLTLDEKGIPENSQQRVEIAQRILNSCLEYGIPKQDIIIDCLTMTVGADQKNAQITIDAVRKVSQLGLKTALGVSNVSFGMPRRDLVNRTFFTLALEAGLTLPIMNPAEEGMMEAMSVFKMLWGYDLNGEEYIAQYANSAPQAAPSLLTGGVDISAAVKQGLEQQSADIVREMLKTLSPNEIIAEKLIPILDEVGISYEKNEIFLPQLIRCAAAAKCAFDVVRETIAKSNVEPKAEETIVIATVKGDIHDIGKNIVRAVLENYGYRIIDLGRDVAPQAVLDAVLNSNAKLCGLSALMTTTLPSMEETIKLIQDKADFCQIVVGGAVLTEEYAKKIGADYYAKDAAATVAVAKQIFS